LYASSALPRVPDVKDGIVFIAEDEDMVPVDGGIADACWFTGRFSAHWEAEDGREFREGPKGVSAREAVAWGREQAKWS
jgi:hypothetical protein